MPAFVRRTRWPFGRDAHRTEILALLDAVPGVDAVTALTLTGPDGATCGRVCVGATGLAVSGAHNVEVRGSHIGLAYNQAVYKELLNALG